MLSSTRDPLNLFTKPVKSYCTGWGFVYNGDLSVSLYVYLSVYLCILSVYLSISFSGYQSVRLA